MPKSRLNSIRTLSAVLLLAACAAFGAGCAKIAEPQPPEIRVPKPASDLAARQVADSIVLTFAKPSRNTNGSEAKTLATIEVFRLIEDRNGDARKNPLPEDQFVRRASRIRSIAAPGFSGFLQGESFVIQDKPEPPDKSSIYSHAFRYAVLFINKKNQTAGFSNQAFIGPIAMPPAPVGLSAKVTEKAILLSWDPPSENMDGSKPPHVTGYDLFRSDDPQKLPGVPLNPGPLVNPEFEDRNFQFDKTYYYTVRVVGSFEDPTAVSALSGFVQVETRDIFPPAPPENVNAIREGGDIVLLWAPSASADVAGYRIWRQDKKSGARVLLQKDPIAALSYRDRQVESEAQYEYSIQAVDTHGNESSPVRAEVETR